MIIFGSSDYAKLLRDMIAASAQDRTDIQRLRKAVNRSSNASRNVTGYGGSAACDCPVVDPLYATFTKLTSTATCLDELDGNTYAIPETPTISGQTQWTLQDDLITPCVVSGEGTATFYKLFARCYKLVRSDPGWDSFRVTIGDTVPGGGEFAYPFLLIDTTVPNVDVSCTVPFVQTLTLDLILSSSSIESGAWEVVLSES